MQKRFMSALEIFKSDFGKFSAQASGLISAGKCNASFSCSVQPKNTLHCTSGSTRVCIDISAIPDAPLGWQDSNECPFEIDLIKTFYIPTRAIQCTVDTQKAIECEGVLYCEDRSISVFAMDVENFDWFELQIKLI